MPDADICLHILLLCLIDSDDTIPSGTTSGYTVNTPYSFIPLRNVSRCYSESPSLWQ